MLVGFHVEGNDHLIFRCLLARLLGCEERDIEPDCVDAPDHGLDRTLRLIPAALMRFHAKSARLALIAVDNDGARGNDARHPRHWTHAGTTHGACRLCRLHEIVAATRRKLTWDPAAERWPVVVAVPVEAVESWLLACRGLLEGRGDELRAEDWLRVVLKQRFYERPAALREDVEGKALPLLRALDAEQFAALARYSHSYALFAEQVQRERDAILTLPPI
jgi:hypothetical protein